MPRERTDTCTDPRCYGELPNAILAPLLQRNARGVRIAPAVVGAEPTRPLLSQQALAGAANPLARVAPVKDDAAAGFNTLFASSFMLTGFQSPAPPRCGQGRRFHLYRRRRGATGFWRFNRRTARYPRKRGSTLTANGFRLTAFVSCVVVVSVSPTH